MEVACILPHVGLYTIKIRLTVIVNLWLTVKCIMGGGSTWTHDFFFFRAIFFTALFLPRILGNGLSLNSYAYFGGKKSNRPCGF